MNTNDTAAEIGSIGAETPVAAVTRLRSEVERLETELRMYSNAQIESWDDPRLATLSASMRETAVSEGVEREYEVMAEAVGLPQHRSPHRVHTRITVDYPVTVDATSETDAQSKVLDQLRESGARAWVTEHLGITLPADLPGLTVSPRFATAIN